MPLLRNTTLGIDFGTSNSAVAVRQAGQPARLLALEGAATGLPTALFFNTENPQDQRTHFGRDAIEQYLSGTEGRLMRSLKSLLGSALLQDKTVVHNSAISYQDIIALFLQMLAQQARSALGGLPERVVLGRPVHFVDDHPARDQQAQEALRQAARAAGFGEVSFQLEPIAAALDYEQRITQESLVLVVDIGGGTSDFSVVRLGPQRAGKADRSADVLATTGVHIGGTDFDRKLSQARVMPLLGLGHIGPHGREVPSKVFHDLSTWHLIQWRYAPQAVREAQALRSDYCEPALHARLMAVLNQRLGHRVAEAVEQVKIGVSAQGHAAPVRLEWLEPNLQALLSPDEMAHDLQALLAQVVACARACLQRAGLPAQGTGVDAIYLTGGSSALRPLRRALALAFPETPQIEGDLFGGVASGLACAGD
ncbi:MAG: Hsp70 family protein [Giesbergeria sp.]|nr:Hsp70 family protein [Giesbergeria sp.]MBP8839395.1 Hsp70 family protein [Giesbergeria sp.]